jgi:hypothetical protein
MAALGESRFGEVSAAITYSEIWEKGPQSSKPELQTKTPPGTGRVEWPRA